MWYPNLAFGYRLLTLGLSLVEMHIDLEHAIQVTATFISTRSSRCNPDGKNLMLFLVEEKRGLQILSASFLPGSAAFGASSGVSGCDFNDLLISYGLIIALHAHQVTKLLGIDIFFTVLTTIFIHGDFSIRKWLLHTVQGRAICWLKSSSSLLHTHKFPDFVFRFSFEPRGYAHDGCDLLGIGELCL